MIQTLIESLTSGECRYIEREDIHVYCHAPLVRTTGLDGRTRWERRPETARYCVVCPEAGLGYGTWVTAETASVTVSRILHGIVPAAA